MPDAPVSELVYIDVALLYAYMCLPEHPGHHAHGTHQTSHDPDHGITLPQHFNRYPCIFREIQGAGIQPGADIGKMPKIRPEEKKQKQGHECQVKGPTSLASFRIKWGEFWKQRKARDR